MGVGVGFNNCFWVYSCSWTTFIFYVSFNYDIWFGLNFGVIFLLFRALVGYFSGWGSVTTFISYISFNFDIWFSINVGAIFDLLEPKLTIFWGGVGFEHFFLVYSWTWTTFIFYVTFNSDIWFWLNFGVIFYFLGP